MRPSRSAAAARRGLLGLAILLCSAGLAFGRGSIDEALLGPEPIAVPALYLEVVVNGASTQLIAEFEQRPDGSLAVSGAELAEIGLLADPEALAPDGLYDLARFDGLTYEYDAMQQVIAIEAQATAMATRVIDAGAGAPASGEPDAAWYGGVVNYSLFGQLSDLKPAAALSLDARFFSSFGLLTQSGIVGYRAGEPFNAIRLDSTFTRSNPDRMVSYRVGDVVTGGLAWTRPTRIGGFQISRNFGLRPDLVTMPIPEFAGTAAVPSTVDVFVNNAQVYTGQVASGPFSIANLPVVSGAGTARVVVTDSTGRTTETQRAFFASSQLLAKDLLDYSLEGGLPRRAYGLESFDYAVVPALFGTARYGLTDRLTLEGHAEASTGLINGGVGVRTPIGNRALLSLAVAASAGSSGVGGLVSADATVDFGKAELRVVTQRSFGAYADVASATALATDAGMPRALDQASLSLPISGNSSATLSFANLETRGGQHRGVVGLSYGRTFGADTNFSVSGLYNFGEKPGAALMVGFSRPLPFGASAAVGGRIEEGRVAGTLSVAGNNKREDAASWRGAASLEGDGTVTSWQASVSRATQLARVTATGFGLRGSIGANVEISGVVAATPAGAFLARRISDAFAVVDAGAPGVTVYADNRAIGRTNTQGRLLVPDLRSYERNAISIAADELPLDVIAEDTKRVVTPADRSGVLVDFAVASVADSAIVTFREADGDFVEVGAAGEVEGGEEFIVGYDGEAYIGGLAAYNRVTITEGDGHSCTAEFALPIGIEGPAFVRDVPCV